MAVVDRPRCFLDVSVGDEPFGRLIIELFADKAPHTCQKYLHLYSIRLLPPANDEPVFDNCALESTVASVTQKRRFTA